MVAFGACPGQSFHSFSTNFGAPGRCPPASPQGFRVWQPRPQASVVARAAGAAHRNPFRAFRLPPHANRCLLIKRGLHFTFLCNMDFTTTICAIATAPGMGAIATIRVSGPDAFKITGRLFYKSKKPFNFSEAPPYSLHYGSLIHQNQLIDDVVVAVFKGPRSYTGTDTVEITCHGSVFIQQQIMEALLASGAVLAEPGEFSMRAFYNGKMDLSQAEAVADLIASENAASHQMALQQMRGRFSQRLSELREQLINFAALIELELDFGEEDVEFADRTQLLNLIALITKEIKQLIQSFAVGNVLKNGLPVAIVGPPNAGKSTLLNALLQEDRAIVSDIAGTTRDAIEDEITLQGVRFRFIDTAGIRATTDVVEAIGIQKTHEKIEKAGLVILLFDLSKEHIPSEFAALIQQHPQKQFLLVGNKSDAGMVQPDWAYPEVPFVAISALNQTGLEELTTALVAKSGVGNWGQADIIVSNVRHKNALEAALAALVQADQGLRSGLSGDLVAFHLRDALRDLGTITGQIEVDRDILGTIFGKFCIGK